MRRKYLHGKVRGLMDNFYAAIKYVGLRDKSANPTHGLLKLNYLQTASRMLPHKPIFQSANIGCVPMIRLLVSILIACMLPLPAYSFDNVCAPQSLIKVVTSMESPDLPADHFYRVPKTLYRIGERQGRAEEAFNPKTGIHLLIVVNEPDMWMVNLAERRGRHMIDPGPTFIFRASIFGEAAVRSTFIRNFEIGCEIQRLHKAGVKPAKTSHATLGDVNRMEFIEGEERLILYEKSNKPLRLELMNGERLIVAMNYLSYEVGLKIRPELFTKPDGIVFETKSGT